MDAVCADVCAHVECSYSLCLLEKALYTAAVSIVSQRAQIHQCHVRLLVNSLGVCHKETCLIWLVNEKSVRIGLLSGKRFQIPILQNGDVER